MVEPGLAPNMYKAVVQLDNDLHIDAGAVPVCDPASLFGTTTAEAIAACPGSVVGNGSSDTTVTGHGALTLFNGAPDAGNPTLIEHVRLDSGFTYLFPGFLNPLTGGGDFASQLEFDLIAPGLTHIDLRYLGEPTPGVDYLTATCSDADQIWNYDTTLSFSYGHYLLPQTVTASLEQPCQVDDGVDPGVDPDPGTESGNFDDREGTSGTVTDAAGLEVRVTDAPTPDGVRIQTTGTGGPAILTVCGPYTLKVWAGSDIVLTCGSVIVRVTQAPQPVQIETAGGSVVVTVPAGGSTEVTDNGDGTATIDNSASTVPVTVSVNGGPASTVDAGGTSTTPPPSGGGDDDDDGGGTVITATAMVITVTAITDTTATAHRDMAKAKDRTEAETEAEMAIEVDGQRQRRDDRGRGRDH